MAFEARKKIPGRADVNDLFSKNNLLRTKRAYKKIVESGGYHFGDLSAWYCGLTDKEKRLWEKEIDGWYPADVQAEAQRIIEAGLNHTDEFGVEKPIPIKFNWIGPAKDDPPFAVRTTYNHAEPSYSIEFIGYPSPMGQSFLLRNGKDDGPDSVAEEPED